MHKYGALAWMQRNAETARLSAELFLRKALRIGCSLNYSLEECVAELNTELEEHKIGKCRSIQEGIDAIVKTEFSLPITVHGLKQFLKRKIPASNMILEVPICKHNGFKNWVCTCVYAYN
jgi:hypothetical protein